MSNKAEREFGIAPFTGNPEDWEVWGEKFKALLDETDGLLDIIMYKRPEFETDGVRDRWHRKNSKVYGKLIKHIDGKSAPFRLVSGFRESRDGKQAWHALEAKYEPHGHIGLTSLHQDLHSTELGETQDPDDFFGRLEAIQAHMGSLGEPMSDKHLMAHAVTKLPANYESLRVLIEHDDNMTYDRLKQMVRARHHRHLHEVTEGGRRETDKALMTLGFQGKCRACGGVGHRAADCANTKLNAPGDGQAATGGAPGGRGGQGGGGGRGQGQRGGRGRGRGGQRGGGAAAGGWRGQGTPKPKCTYCKKPGHTAEVCYSRLAAHMAEQFEEALTAIEPSDLLALTAHDPTTDLQQKWVVDSGCTSHMVSTRAGITNFRPQAAQIRIGDGRFIQSIGKGTYKGLASTAKGGTTTLRLEDVMVVPELKLNLFSVTAASTRGASVTLDSIGGWITTTRATVIPFPKVGRLYVLTLPPVQAPAASTPTTLTAVGSTDDPDQSEDHSQSASAGDLPSPPTEPTGGGTTGAGSGARSTPATGGGSQRPTSTSTANLWHRRLGHGQGRDLRRLGALGVGVPQDLPVPDQCEPCELSKHTLHPFRKGPGSRATKPLALVHTDLVGPVEPSIGGVTLAIIFTDDATRYRKVYFLARKSEALLRLKQYQLDMAALVPGERILQLRSDFGGEFLGKDFETYSKSQGITQDLRGPYAAQLNGVAERSWRTVVDMARCLRLAAGLEKALWPEALTTAVYLTNRLPTKALGGNTPYYALFGKQAPMGHLKTFGCQAYVHIYDHQRKKLDAKAKAGIFIGYDELDTMRYKVYFPEIKQLERQIQRSVHVTFNESVMPAKQGVTWHPDVKNKIEQRHPLPPVAKPGVPDAQEAGEPKNQDPVEQVEPGSPAAPKAQDQVAQDQVGEKEGPGAPAATSSPKARDPVGSHGAAKASGASQAKTKTQQGHAEAKASGVPKAKPAEKKQEKPARSRRARTATTCQDPNCKTKGVHKAHLTVAMAYTAAEQAQGDPKTYKEAIQSPESQEWARAMQEEFDALINNQTWELVEAPPHRNVVDTKWVYKTKRGPDGSVARYKARLVAKGFTQQEGVDFSEVYAPTAKLTSVRAVLSLAATEDWELHQMDVDTAFLQSPVEEEIYIRLPEDYRQWASNGRELVGRVAKSIYGLRQSSRNWNKVIDKWLKQGYKLVPDPSDPCVYVVREAENILVIVLYVDDLIIAGSLKMVIAFKKAISKRFKMKDLGELQWVLGMEITRDRSKRTLEINQTAYIEQTLAKYGMTDCKPVGAPAEGSLTRLTEEEADPNSEYRAVVGSLLYAALVTRPDIAYAVQALGRHLNASGPEHWLAAKRVLRYLQGTKNKTLKYSPSAKTQVSGYSDSDWASDLATRRSTTGYVFMLGNGALSWGSRLQPTVALSSAEAEYMAVTAAVQEALHLRQLFDGLGYGQDGPTVILEDNQGCMALAVNTGTNPRTKHIAIRYHFIRDHITNGQVKLVYVPTEHQLADIFTKPLLPMRIADIRDRVLGHIIVK